MFCLRQSIKDDAVETRDNRDKHVAYMKRHAASVDIVDKIVVRHVHLHDQNLTRKYIIMQLYSSNDSSWLGSVVVGRRTSDRKIAGSTPGRCIAG